MIFGKRSQIYDAKLFAEGIARALSGIVRVTIGEGSPVLCTGWLLTPRIVVVPAYVLSTSEQSMPVPFSNSSPCIVRNSAEPTAANLTWPFLLQKSATMSSCFTFRAGRQLCR